MDKKPKLNLEPPDFSKAKLNLKEESTSMKIDPNLKLNSESVGIATAFQKIAQDIEKAYENPSLKAYMQAEEDRSALIKASIERWNEPSLQTKMREYGELLKSPAYAMALEKPTSIQNYAAQIANSFDNKNYEEAKKTLENFYPQMSSTYLIAQSAVEQMQKTIDSPSIQSSLSQLANLGMYESAISKAAESIAKNEDLLGSSKILAGLGTSLASDSLKLKMDDYSRINAQIIPKEYPRIEIPQNPIIKQNVQLIQILHIIKEQNDNSIEQNTQLLTIQKSQQDMQSSLYVEMQQQNNLNEIVIEQLKVQNDGIKDQLKELKRQNDNLEKQLQLNEKEISDNRDSDSFTRKLALWGIGISIFVGILSSIIPYNISNKETIENDSDNAKLLGAINNKAVENQKQDQLIKLIEEENKYLKKLAEREPK